MVEGDAPSDPSADDTNRAMLAWRSWLSALAKDAEAALAAAMTYGSLEDAAREAWLDALDADASAVDVPRVALYAPLLAVELDGARRDRIARAIGADRASPPVAKALCGTSVSGDSICAIVTPLYLEFVEVLVCRYHPDEGVRSAHHDPLRNVGQIDASVTSLVGERIALVPAPLGVVIEDLAHAVVADRRQGRPSPALLSRFSHLFGPDLQDERDEEQDCPAA